MTTQSPFHSGERAVQARVGVRDKAEALGERMIRDFMPDEHREFYANLPYLLVGSVDDNGQPWASMLFGRPGFASSPDAKTLEVHARPTFGDPLADNLVADARLGFLGIDYATRRRNRLTGRVRDTQGTEFTVDVEQAFGNCPRFIQKRVAEVTDRVDQAGEALPVTDMSSLNARAREIIAAADHFFIATYYSADDQDQTQGADVSHRGGKPGFVRIDSDQRLTFPDFRGNNHYNTLGNLELNPRAGLLFPDFETGDLLYVAARAEITWNGNEVDNFHGAKQLVHFDIESVRRVASAMPVDFRFEAYSPFLKKTGDWEAAA